MTGPPHKSVKGVLPRAVLILRALSKPHVQSLRASEIAIEAGLPLQTTLRLLLDMSRAGLTMRDDQGRRWSLGPFAFTLGAAAGRQIDWGQRAIGVLSQLTYWSQETAILTARRDAYGVHVAIVDSPQKLHLTDHVGTRLPLNLGASGRSILAYLPDTEKKNVLGELRSAGEVFDTEWMEEECIQIRQQGYALTEGERDEHTVGIASPIFQNYLVVGSLMVAGPDFRLNGDGVKLAVTSLLRAVESFRDLGDVTTRLGDGQRRGGETGLT